MKSSPEAYIICTTPRSGSTLLCKLLAATGISGEPDSLFHRPSLAAWCGAYGLEAQSYPSTPALLEALFDAAIAKGSKGGIFGLRLQRQSVDFFMEQLAILVSGETTEKARIERAFGPTLFIHLTRANKLDQAISYVKANQTGLWHRNADGSELERTAPPKPPVYDAEAITNHINRFRQTDAAWRAWFTREAVTPLTLQYNDLAATPSAILATVLKALKLEPSCADTVEPLVAKLADATNEEWALRYRQEHKD